MPREDRFLTVRRGGCAGIECQRPPFQRCIYIYICSICIYVVYIIYIYIYIYIPCVYIYICILSCKLSFYQGVCFLPVLCPCSALVHYRSVSPGPVLSLQGYVLCSKGSVLCSPSSVLFAPRWVQRTWTISVYH